MALPRGNLCLSLVLEKTFVGASFVSCFVNKDNF